MFEFGCSAISEVTKDNNHLFGRNLDFNRLSAGTGIIYVPANYKYYVVGSKYDNTLVEENSYLSKYAVLGIGTNVLAPTMALYDGQNEKGLAGAQLYYREYAHFTSAVKPGTYAVQPPYFLVHALSQCQNVAEVIDLVQNKITLIAKPLLGSIPTIHFIFTDKSGQSVVIEPDADGLKIYPNQLGILTNSPSYSWQTTNLANYMNLTNHDFDNISFSDVTLKQSFSGNGLHGLPGDFSSPSRFCRLSFLKKYGVKGDNEALGVEYVFHYLANVTFPLGLVEVSEPGTPTEKDENIVPYDYTIYSVVYSLDKGNIYYKTYQNSLTKTIGFADFKQDLIVIPLEFEPKFKKISY